ncbi:MAG: shikimate dehydrogenase [Bacteroidales bacterium]|nr:shikimate dehydrogenase [Bacteroidales bacterium]
MLQKKVFALLGYPLSHSFSQRYFTDKFIALGLKGYKYECFEIKTLSLLPNIIQDNPLLQGFNVTSPYKQEIFSYLDEIDEVAKEIFSVNCVKVEDNKLIGFNTDWLAFRESLKKNANIRNLHRALILGSGGAAKSVAYALNSLNISYVFVSRSFSKEENYITYEDLNKEHYNDFDLIVNATPCGLDSYPAISDIDTRKINSKHVVFDLIYNPTKTTLLCEAYKNGAKIINGLEMLYLQAEFCWKIWNKI